jgi:hypothetical protein
MANVAPVAACAALWRLYFAISSEPCSPTRHRPAVELNCPDGPLARSFSGSLSASLGKERRGFPLKQSP